MDLIDGSPARCQATLITTVLGYKNNLVVDQFKKDHLAFFDGKVWIFLFKLVSTYRSPR